MENVKSLIIQNLQKAVKEITGLDITPDLFHPSEEGHGDYSTNAAMALWANQESRIKNQEYKNSFELAQKIADSIIHNSRFMIHFDRVEAAAPGFINFFLSEKYLTTLMIHIIRVKDAFGSSEKLKGKNIMVEFTDPNPFKEFHIGHLYSNTVGESLSRLLEAQGGDVRRSCYQGDIGLHVAKTLYGIQNLKLEIQDLEKKSLKEKIKALGQAYALGTKFYEEDKNAKIEIEQLNKKIYDKDPAITVLYEKGRQWSLEYFGEIYKRLGTKFDFYYFESEVGKDGLNLVKEYLKKGIFEESQGAVIFPGEKFGLHNRVFINSLGLPTYEAKDLGLAPTKYKDFAYDLSIIITAAEQSGYFKVVLKALSLIDPELGAKTKHIAHGVVRLPTGKMSSRSGNIITGEWLLDEAKKILKSKYPEMEEDTLEKVAVGSVKYALLKSSIGHDIEFNFEESINMQGNSGPYLQYTFARTQSVLAKVKTQNSKLASQGLALQAEEVSLLRALNRFTEIVEEAGEKFAPNLLCNYLFDLAQKFNLFYQKHKILQSRTQDFKVDLTSAVGQVLKNGLKILGIQAPERM